MNIRDIDTKALKNMCKSLSTTNLNVQCTYDHILDRAKERSIDVIEIMKAMRECNNHICMDLYESALVGGCKNFKRECNNIKLYYSVYSMGNVYNVTYRTVV